MRRISVVVVLAASLMMLASLGLSQEAPTAGAYKVLKTAKVGGEGGYDYIFADVEGRRLYIPRGGATGQLTVFNLDTLEPSGSIADVRSGGATVDPKSHHGFSTTKPITMWDATTLKVIKTIDVDGRPDGILCDPYNARVWVLSHQLKSLSRKGSRNEIEATADLQRGNESTHRAGGDQGAEDHSGNRFALRRTSRPGGELEAASDSRSAGTVRGSALAAGHERGSAKGGVVPADRAAAGGAGLA